MLNSSFAADRDLNRFITLARYKPRASYLEELQRFLKNVGGNELSKLPKLISSVAFALTTLFPDNDAFTPFPFNPSPKISLRKSISSKRGENPLVDVVDATVAAVEDDGPAKFVLIRPLTSAELVLLPPELTFVFAGIVITLIAFGTDGPVVGKEFIIDTETAPVPVPCPAIIDDVEDDDDEDEDEDVKVEVAAISALCCPVSKIVRLDSMSSLLCTKFEFCCCCCSCWIL